MKKLIITLGLVSVFTLAIAGNALAMVGAEPPPEGMMGITAIQEPAIEPAVDPKGDGVEPNEGRVYDPVASEVAPVGPDDPVIYYAVTNVQDGEQPVSDNRAGTEDIQPNWRGADTGQVMEATTVKAGASQGAEANKDLSAGMQYGLSLAAAGVIIGIYALRRKSQQA